MNQTREIKDNPQPSTFY